jgi:uncharacterized membrane protein
MTVGAKLLQKKIKEKAKPSPEKEAINGFITVVSVCIFITLIATLIMVICSSCTLNMIMTHTEGSASDVVDSNPETKPQVEATVKIPTIP